MCTRNEVLTSAMKESILLSPEAIEVLESADIDEIFLQTVLHHLKSQQGLISKEDIMSFLSGDKALCKSEKFIPNKVRPNGDIKVLSGTDITGNSTCTGTIKDFVGYFKSRYNLLEQVLKENTECKHHTSIASAKLRKGDVCLVVMVFDIRKSKNKGHIIIDVEDPSGSCTAFIGKDDPLASDPIVTDEVLGLAGRFSESGLFIIRKIIRPSVPKNHKWVDNLSDASIAFISDVHVGSNEFLKNGWNRMMNWMKHNAEREEINYLILAGDVVDGIGVYPDQELDLNVKDIYKQYEVLSDLLKDIPDHMQILMHPGNHDACRLAEPQPALNKMFTETIDSHINITGNPITVEVEGRTIVSYHGKSFDDWVGAIPGASYEQPLSMMEHMLDSRHLAPIYGKKNALAPEKSDYLAMVHQPDIIVTGHIHNLGAEEYKGVKLINASAYQAQTSYQRQHNFNPVPCILPVVHLGTGRITLKNFAK